MSVAATRFAHAEGRVCLAYKSDGEKVGEDRGGVMLTDWKYKDLPLQVVSVGTDGEMRVWTGIDDDDCECHLIGDEVLAVSLCDSKIFAGVSGTNVLSGFNWEGDSEGVVGPRLASDVTAVASSPDGSSVVVGCADFSVKLINTTSFATVNLTGHTAPILSVDITSQADFVASSSCDGSVRVWSSGDEKDKRVSLPNLHPKSNDVPNSPTVAGLKFSKDGALLAVPGAQEVQVLQRSNNWASKGKARLENLGKNEMVTCLDWDRQDKYIVAATNKGNLCIISYPALELVKTVPSGRNQNICCIINNPVKDEAFFADLGGHWGLLENIGGGSSPDVPKEEDLEDMEALFNDDEDDENSFSVSKVTAQSGYVKDEDGNLTFGGQRGDQERPSSALSEVSEATGAVSELRAAVAPVRVRTQPAFQPGASPEGLSNR